MAWAEARAGAGDETDQACERLAGFRRELYRCFTARADALSELCDAALCKQDRVHMLAELSLEPGISAAMAPCTGRFRDKRLPRA